MSLQLGNSSQRWKKGKREEKGSRGMKFNMWSEERVRGEKYRCRIESFKIWIIKVYLKTREHIQKTFRLHLDTSLYMVTMFL